MSKGITCPYIADDYLSFHHRAILEMTSGLNTACHLTPPYKDEGSLVTMSHHALLDTLEPDSGWWFKIDADRR